MSSYFTIVRHGQTPYNVAKVVQSRTGGELTERGAEMARSLGKHLKDVTFSKIFSSDLQRCRDTTANITSQMGTPIPSIVYLPILRERDYGDWEFLSQDVCQKRRLEMGLPLYRAHEVEVLNGETYEECKKRAGKFFSEICQIVDSASENEPENILAVSHGNFIQCLLDHIREHPASFELREFDPESLKGRIENTCRTRFAVEKQSPGEKRVITFTHVYDYEHLNGH